MSVAAVIQHAPQGPLARVEPDCKFQLFVCGPSNRRSGADDLYRKAGVSRPASCNLYGGCNNGRKGPRTAREHSGGNHQRPRQHRSLPALLFDPDNDPDAQFQNPGVSNVRILYASVSIRSGAKSISVRSVLLESLNYTSVAK